MTSANLNLPTEYALMTRFDDIDLLREVGQSWDVDFVQIERGQFSGDISYVVTQNTHVAKVGLGRALNQHGAPPVGMRTLVVPSSNTSRFEWRGLKVTGQDILAFPPGGGLSCVSRSGFEVTIVSVAEDLLARVSERMGIPPLDRLLSGSEAISSSRKMMRRLRTALRALERNLQDHSFSLGEPKMRELLDDEIPRRLLDAVGATVEIRETTSRRTRELALKRVLDFIEANEEDSVSLRQLCTAAMVGERTLQYAFKERFGVGPKEYLTAFKLNRVRR